MEKDIELQLGGALVEGRVVAEGSASLCVELTRPYGPFVLRHSLPRAAVGADAELVDHGRETLDLLYRIASYVHDNRIMLVEILSRIFSNLGLLTADAIDAAKLAEYRRRLGRQLAQGEIDTEQHDSHLRTVQERHRVFQRRLREEMERFFQTAFPMRVPGECWEQVLGMIGGQPSTA